MSRPLINFNPTRRRPPRVSRSTLHTRRGGYVLLMTLLILALAATITAQVCRSSYARAARSVEATEELQRRWGAFSCRRTLLPLTEDVLVRAEQRQGRPVRSLRMRVLLNRQAFELVFSDESAKVDANRIVQSRGKLPAEAIIKTLVHQTGSDVPIHLLAGRPQKARTHKKPSKASGDLPAEGDSAAAAPSVANLSPATDTEDEDEYRPLQSFGQVFPDADPSGIVGSAVRSGASAEVTCWGDGRLNLRRASSAGLRQFCPPLLTAGQTNRLIRVHEQSPGAPMADVLAALQLPEETEDALSNQLSDRSTCHSLWVIATTAERSWYDLAIADDSGGTVSFSW